jgi:hypothetical protein
LLQRPIGHHRNVGAAVHADLRLDVAELTVLDQRIAQSHVRVEPVLVQAALWISHAQPGRVNQQAHLRCVAVINRLDHPSNVLILVHSAGLHLKDPVDLWILKVNACWADVKHVLLAAQRLRMAAGDDRITALHHLGKQVVVERLLLQPTDCV